MNRKTRYILLLLMVRTVFSFSQNQTMNNTTKEIMLQGKETIIAYAFTIIKERMPELEINPEDYEIRVWANKTEALVKFRRLINYYPINKQESRINDFSVNILTQETDIWSVDDFHTLTKQDLENIKFVKKHYGLPPTNEFEISIYEHEDHFSINVDNEVAFGRYFIYKITGKQSPSIQSSYIPMPPSTSEEINEDPLKEILDSTTQNEILNIITITVVDKIKQLGRDAIIELAQQELTKKNINIDPNDYRIRVIANSTTIFVSFHIPIKYLPLNSIFYGDIGVNIIEKN